MKAPHQYHASNGTSSPRVKEHNVHNVHRGNAVRQSMAPTTPVFEVKRTACSYGTGKSQSSPNGKPGMGKSSAC